MPWYLKVLHFLHTYTKFCTSHTYTCTSKLFVTALCYCPTPFILLCICIHTYTHIYIHSHNMHCNAHHHIYLDLPHCAVRTEAPHVTEPWLSVGDGGLMPLYISLHMAAPPSQPGVSVFISPNRMKSFTPQCLHTYLYSIQSYCCLPMTTRGLKVQVQISPNLMKPFTSLL